MKSLNKKKFKLKNIFKINITKKILLIYFFLLISTVSITSIFSYYFFQKFMDNIMFDLDVNIDKIKIKLQEMYDKEKGKIFFELPDINKLNKEGQGPLIEPFVKDLPDYKFKVETVEGTVEYEEKPKLVYDNKEGKYFFEVTRQIKFAESKQIKAIKLSIKLEFYKIILKSLLYGSMISVIFLIPVILLFSWRIIINPILKVSKGVRNIAGGKLGVVLQSKSKDELGELIDSFNYMSKELFKIKRIRDDLLAVISHELRSPLGRIKGYTELINDLELNKKERGIYFNSIFNEIDFVNHMIGEIIEISRLELNKEQLFLEKIDIAILLDEIKNEIELTTPLHDIKYEFRYSRGLDCLIDVDKIKRVILNILDNSKKAKATNVVLNAEKKEEIIYIKIIDNGIGMSEDQLELVFEKFYRVDKSRDRKTGGFGLGLAICRGIINEHKGKIYFIKRDTGAELHIELICNLILEEKNEND